MSETTDQLPTDIEALQALVAAARAERDAAIAKCDAAIVERDHAVSQMDRLQHLLRQLQRAQFGRRSEKLDPEQLQLAIEDIEQAIASDEAAQDRKDTAGARQRAERRRASRGALPAHLPHIDVTIAPEVTCCPCCRAPLHVIGEETSRRLDVVPAQFRVIVTHRPKYACRACTDGVVQAPAPERLIKGGLPTEAMVAHVLVAKYAWHLPLYRQAQMLLAQGIDIKRSVLAFWVGYAAAELRPLWLRLRETILTASKIAVDETTAPVLDPGRGRTKKGFFWAIARDDRPWGGADPPAVAYTYAPGRGAVHALKLLDGYRGIVQCDGYTVYKTVADTAPDAAITLAFCWAHLRRRFFDVVQDGPAPIASEALERIAALYAIEKSIKGRSADERRAVRQERSKPQVVALKAWFEQQLTRVSGKATIAEHIRYALNHWVGLTRFLDDGHIELDNNIVERSIRPLILNRKNALFAGHDEGAENWACIASLIETCKLCGVEPQAYLTDVLTRLVNLWPASRLDELMPWAWAAERANGANSLAA
ncbi:IS66 family transposase [Bradyrhizobium sp. CCGUVB23]|uniref:IS66 family transposase n=1 Tax=Bradyrhizobium sp. CCGUVB23 TaxID=2949630 RepID=UPI0020B201E6|nr:IS66 family transposase [Bradyrhizobium sp. CCGUVB23]MCP3468073.1 IS66 family transposase [Bradyrhizobium sp. CCGUVB23]